MEQADFFDLKGEILTEIAINEESNRVTFITESGKLFEMYHEQDCCESVYLAEVVGDLRDLIGLEILRADEETSAKEGEYGNHETWSFYKLATRKGYVDFRWYGTSNGYYSESVSVFKFDIAEVK